MLCTVRKDLLPLGVADLPAGLLVAARLEPTADYAAFAGIVRRATDAFLHLGLYDAAAPSTPDVADEGLHWRRALRRAAGLRLSLVDVHGAALPTQFVNLLEAPGDRGIVVVASFAIAPTPVVSRRFDPRDTQHEERWEL